MNRAKFKFINGKLHRIIFRMSRICPNTGKLIRSRKPMPIWVEVDSVNLK